MSQLLFSSLFLALSLAPQARAAEAGTSDRFAQVKGFRVDIDTGDGKDTDTSWESVSGGDMTIEVTETTVGSDKFQPTTPGHVPLGEITLKGVATDSRGQPVQIEIGPCQRSPLRCLRLLQGSGGFPNESSDLTRIALDHMAGLAQGKNIRKNITIVLNKSDKTPGRSYSLVDCFPVAWSTVANGSDGLILIEGNAIVRQESLSLGCREIKNGN